MELRTALDAEAVEALGHVAGIVAAIVGLAGVAMSVVLADGFSPREQALSELGQAGAATAWLFNGSLAVAGTLGAVFAASLLFRLAHPMQRLGVGILGLAALGLAGVGVFPMGEPLHLPAAALFFVGLTVGLVVVGLGDREAGRPMRSRVSLNLAFLHLLAWAFGYATLGGVALPELVGGIVFALWIVIVVIQRGRDLHVPVRG
ncbi:MAG: DUF998 domain-containing protein [Halobacteriales archaeon]